MRGRRFHWLVKGVSITLGMVLAGVAAYAATNWVVGLTSNSSGEAQSATISQGDHHRGVEPGRR